MAIKVDNNSPFVAFINTPGNTESTSVADHNKSIMEFIAQYDDGKLTIEAFTSPTTGKIIIGFK